MDVERYEKNDIKVSRIVVEWAFSCSTIECLRLVIAKEKAKGRIVEILLKADIADGWIAETKHCIEKAYCVSDVFKEGSLKK